MGALAFYPYSTPLRGLVRMQHVVEILLSTSRFWKLLKLLELGVETKNAPMTMIHASRNIQQFIFQFEWRVEPHRTYWSSTIWWYLMPIYCGKSMASTSWLSDSFRFRNQKPHEESVKEVPQAVKVSVKEVPQAVKAIFGLVLGSSGLRKLTPDRSGGFLTPKSSMLIGCSIINHPFWPILGISHGTPQFVRTVQRQRSWPESGQFYSHPNLRIDLMFVKQQQTTHKNCDFGDGLLLL